MAPVGITSMNDDERVHFLEMIYEETGLIKAPCTLPLAHTVAPPVQS